MSETSREGRLALDMGHLAAGDRLVLYLQLQTNPAQFGRRAQGADLYDGETLVASIDRTVTVFP